MEWVNKPGRWWEDREKGEDTGKVLLYYVQSLYYQTVSDQRAQFNEAVFLVLSHPLFPSPLFFLPSSSTSLFFSVFCVLPLPLYLSSLFVSVHFCFIFDCSFSLSRWPLSHPHLPSLCVATVPRWIIAQRTVQQMRVPIMSLLREHCCSSLERTLKVRTTVTAIIHDIFSKNMSLRLRLK